MSATPIKQSLFVLSHGTQEEGGSAIDAGYDLDALKRYAEELHAETVREYAEFRAADERDGQPDLDWRNGSQTMTTRLASPIKSLPLIFCNRFFRLLCSIVSHEPN